MFTEQEIEDSFTYHTPTESDIEKYKEIRKAALDFGKLLLKNCPATPTRTLAIRKLEETVMWANKSIACHKA